MPRKTLIILAAVLASASLHAATETFTPTATSTVTPTITRTATLTQTPTVTRTATRTHTQTNSPSPTISTTFTRSATMTITRTPQPPTATVTETVVSNLSLYKQAFPTVVVSGQIVQYRLGWILNSFPGPTPSYIEIVDTLPAGFNYTGALTSTPYPSPTPGGPTPIPTAALCNVTITGNVFSARWCAPSVGNQQGIIIQGAVFGPMGSTLWNLFSGSSDSGYATTYSAPEPVVFATATPTLTAFLSATATPTQSPTGSPTSTPIPAADTLIDDFEDGDTNCSHGGSWSGTNDAGGSSVIILPAPGCHDGSPNYSMRAQGSCSGVAGGQYAGLSLSYGGGGIDLNAATGQNRLLGFKAYSLSPLTITVRVNGTGGNSCQVDVYLDGNGWQNCTLALPTHEDPGDLPQLSGSPWALVAGGCTGIDFHCTRSTGGTTPFDFRIDDVQWGGYPTNNRDRVLSWCGCTQSDLDEAYSYGLGEQAVWILLVIRQHCGCHPHDIMALRSTMSWGQICTNYGTDWATVIDEMWNQCEAAGMQPDDPTLDEIYPALRNAVPTPVPVYPYPTPYVPRGPMGVSLPGDC